MRTTLELPDPLLAHRKPRAASKPLALKPLLHSSVEQGLNATAPGSPAKLSAYSLPRSATTEGGGCRAAAASSRARSEQGLHQRSELLLRQRLKQHGFDATSHVLLALIRRFHEAAERGDASVTCWGTGTPLREFLNVGTGVDLTIRALAEAVASTTGWRGFRALSRL